MHLYHERLWMLQRLYSTAYKYETGTTKTPPLTSAERFITKHLDFGDAVDKFSRKNMEQCLSLSNEHTGHVLRYGHGKKVRPLLP